MTEITTVSVPITELKPAEYNPREMSRHDFEALKRSLSEFGFVDPVIVNKDNSIIGGHQRVKAAIELGIEKVPVVYVDLSPEKAKVLNLALNRIHGDWDKEKLKALLSELDNLSVDLTLTGFNFEELSTLLDFCQEDNFQPEDKPVITKRGDVYILGKHRLMCGDSRNIDDVSKLMDGKQARLVFTDPPYNVDYHSPAGLSYDSKKFGASGKIFNDNLSDKECLAFYQDVLKNLYAVTTDDATIYWWFANRHFRLNQQAFETNGWRISQVIIWVKNSAVFSQGQDYHRMYEPCLVGWKKGKRHFYNAYLNNLKDVFNLDRESFEELFDLWYEKRDVTTEYIHPTQKPVRLAQRAIKRNSAPGDIVVDVFGGSGSTLIACDQLHRTAYLLELDPKFCDAIVDRWKKFTGREVGKG